MFDAWQTVGTIAGAGALSYLAASPYQRTVDNQMTLRLSLDSSGSLLGDVRVIGAAGALALRAWLDKDNKHRATLGAVAAASIGSVVVTELIRWQLVRGKINGIAQKLPVIPGNFASMSYGLLGEPAGQRQRQYAR